MDLEAARFSERMAAPFVYKSLSEDTRRAYNSAIRDFFLFVNMLHPRDIQPAHVLAWRDHLISRGRKPSTVATKLSIIRSFFDYLLTGGAIHANPAATKLVPPPLVGDGHAGRALSKKEVRQLLCGPDRRTADGARDYALLLVMLRLSLRVVEVTRLRRSSVKWNGQWIVKCKVKGGREEVWPVPADVKQAIDAYLELDSGRRATVKSDGPEAFLFQPQTNYRTLVFDKGLSRRHVERIVARWADYANIGKVTPHDLRRTVVTRLLEDGHSYRDVQRVTKHRDPKTVMRYDKQRENLMNNPINSLSYDGD
ncbi:MAG TPA: tyrosine-type recombinase/integrase [Pyrinomonadaceae bacterium]|jgi:site-specific recombinase XerD